MIPYKHINVLIMPTDYCNMNCIYCFNSRKTNKRNNKMSLETLEKIFKSTIPHYEKVCFIWHGGEPTSMGIDFYREAVRLQNEINTNGIIIENSIQSNLTLLDDELICFLLDNGFRIGGSFDGTNNGLTRHNSDLILRGRERVIKNGGRVGFICVLQSKNIDCLIDDYEWFKSNGINYTLNLYLSSPPYEEDELFVPEQKCINAVCGLFDYWVNDNTCNIEISLFNEYIGFQLFGEKSVCCHTSCLGKYVGIHYDGTIYNCNRDFPPQYSYGNIAEYTDIHDCFNSPGFNKMVDDAFQRREYCKNNCDIYDFCEGGCCNCSSITGDIKKPNSYFCSVSKALYSHIGKVVKELLNKELDSTKINPHFKTLLERYNAEKNNNKDSNKNNDCRKRHTDSIVYGHGDVYREKDDGTSYNEHFSIEHHIDEMN